MDHFRRIALCTFGCLLLFAVSCNKEKETPVAEKKVEPPKQEVLTKEVPKYSADTFYQTTSFGGANFSHDGKTLLVNSDQTGVFNAYAYAADGSSVTQLTHSDTNAIFGISFFPHDGRLLYSSDEGGNELNHIYLREEDGSVKDLTPGDKVKAQWAGWAGDEKTFRILTNERDSRSFDLYSYSTEDYSRKLVFQNNENLMVDSMSRDGNWLSLVKSRNNADSDIYLWNASTPEEPPKLITPHEGNISYQSLTFSPDSKLLYFLTNEYGEFDQVWSYTLADGTKQKEIEGSWDISAVTFSKNGTYRAVYSNEDARTVVNITRTDTGEKVELPKLPDGDLASARFSPDEKTIAFYLNSDTSPSNLYVYQMADKNLKKLTEALNPSINGEDLVAGKVIRYKSFDGLDIPSILFRPWSASATNKVPALVWVHGGPGGQSRHGYRAAIQHLINHGYAILMVNNRGSSGYGKTFFHMDDRKHGDVDLKDCVYGKKYLQSLDWVDPNRIGIIGGSYGGYMVAAALAFEPEVFNVGINIFGVTNWERTLQNIPPWWESFKEALYAEMGDPAEDAERHHAISPLFHAERITKPLLVVQGANDPRVLQAESDDLVEAVRKNNVPVEYVLFPDEGHGFRRRENRITASEAYVKFLDTHLKKDTEPVQ